MATYAGQESKFEDAMPEKQLWEYLHDNLVKSNVQEKHISRLHNMLERAYEEEDGDPVYLYGKYLTECQKANYEND